MMTSVVRHNFIIYLLILVYTVGLIKPLVPVVHDVVSHLFFRMEHMATIHYENGKYHLHHELGEMAAKSDKSEAKTEKEAEVLSAHLLALPSIFVYENCHLSISEVAGSLPQEVTLKSPTPPPQA